MSLPTIESPKYSLRLPSSGKNVEYRPFLVKEEKILLIAQESGNARDMITSMKDIVKACTFNKIDPNSLTSYDLEFIFLKLRAKSVGETANVKIKCEQCESFSNVEINLDEIEMPVTDNKPEVIMLTEDVGITMRHIRVRDLSNITDEKKGQSDVMMATTIASIENIFDPASVHVTDDTPKEELITFVNSFNRNHMEQIEKFIAATPKVEVNVKFKCENKECQCDNEVTLSGVKSFFE